jgi:TonB family protein
LAAQAIQPTRERNGATMKTGSLFIAAFILLAVAGCGSSDLATRDISGIVLIKPAPGVDTTDLTLPTVVRESRLVYPLKSYQAGIEGEVEVKAQINIYGQVESAEVFSSADLRLDESAMNCVKRSGYSSAQRNGVPVSVSVIITVRFLLKDPMNLK